MSIKKIYKQVVVGNRYDPEIANKHTEELIKRKSAIKAKNMPKIQTEFVQENYVGCCLHYSMYLMHLMPKAAAECYLTITLLENKAYHTSVLYFDTNEKYLIADPVQDIIKHTSTQYMVQI